MPVILLVLGVAFLLFAGLVSAVTGISFDTAVGVLLVLGLAGVAGAGLSWLSRHRSRERFPVARPLPLRRPEGGPRQVVATAQLARQVMDQIQALAVHQHKAFRTVLEEIGADLAEAREQHGGKTADHNPDHFTGPADIPAVLAAFAKDAIRNSGSDLLAVHRIVSRRLAEMVDRGGPPPADLGYQELPDTSRVRWKHGDFS